MDLCVNFLHLPDEVILTICESLSLAALGCFSCVCKTLLRIASDPFLWKSRVRDLTLLPSHFLEASLYKSIVRHEEKGLASLYAATFSASPSLMKEVRTVTLNSSGGVLYAGSQGGEISVFSVGLPQSPHSPRLLWNATLGSSIYSIQPSQMGRLYCGVENGSVHVVNMARPDPTDKIAVSSEYLSNIRLFDNEEKLVSVGGDGEGRVVDLQTRTVVGRLLGHTNWIRSLYVNNDLFITGGKDCCVRVWDPRTYRCVRVLEGPWDLSVWDLVLDDSKNTLYTTHASDIITWDTRTWQHEVDSSFRCSSRQNVCALALNAGKLYAGCFFEDSHVFDTLTKTRIASFPCGSARCIVADNTLVATASDDLLVYDMTGQR